MSPKLEDFLIRVAVIGIGSYIASLFAETEDAEEESSEDVTCTVVEDGPSRVLEV